MAVENSELPQVDKKLQREREDFFKLKGIPVSYLDYIDEIMFSLKVPNYSISNLYFLLLKTKNQNTKEQQTLPHLLTHSMLQTLMKFLKAEIEFNFGQIDGYLSTFQLLGDTKEGIYMSELSNIFKSFLVYDKDAISDAFTLIDLKRDPNFNRVKGFLENYYRQNLQDPPKKPTSLIGFSPRW